MESPIFGFRGALGARVLPAGVPPFGALGAAGAGEVDALAGVSDPGDRP